ncbi:MAG TPA: HAD hydrolase-like protein [Thermoanaerobaculia bacterium]|jgi:phosphoglycolate phosphatase
MSRHLVFDLDGTLTDPRRGITRCLAAALTAAGATVPPHNELLQFIGPPLLQVFLTLLGDPARASVAVTQFRECYGSGGLLENEPCPGIVPALQQLATMAPSLYVATSKPHVYATRILEHFNLAPLFRGVYGCELDGTRSDKSELLAHLLEREGLRGESIVMIGDRRHDIIAARANGAVSVGVTWGFGSAAELQEAGADAVVDTPDELLAWYRSGAAAPRV